MLGEARSALITNPHTSVVPGVMILIIVMAINLLGDGVRDALDPRLKSGALSRPMPATMVQRTGPVPSPEGDDDLLALRGLKTQFHVKDRVYKAVGGVDLSLKPGECLGLIGEAGRANPSPRSASWALSPRRPGSSPGVRCSTRRGSGRRALRGAAQPSGPPRGLYLPGPAGDAASALYRSATS
jgi:peptide/nickel transport system permease protein